MRPALHLLLHFIVPGLVARLGYRDHFWKAWLTMLAGMVIDLDHFLATPLYDPNRCSLSAHPLHSPPAILAYVILTAIPRTRIFGVGLLIHIALDGLDCLWMNCS